MNEQRLTHEEFVKRAIVTLRKDGYKGIHCVYSGFNNAFKQYFPGEDPRAVTERLSKESKIVIVSARGGAMIYLPEDAPDRSDRGTSALKSMGL